MAQFVSKSEFLSCRRIVGIDNDVWSLGDLELDRNTIGPKWNRCELNRRETGYKGLQVVAWKESFIPKDELRQRDFRWGIAQAASLWVASNQS